MKPKRARKLICFLFVAGVLILLLSYIHIIFLPIGLVVAASSIVPNILFNKCPHCGRNLGTSAGDYCPYCGNYIED